MVFVSCSLLLLLLVSLNLYTTFLVENRKMIPSEVLGAWLFRSVLLFSLTYSKQQMSISLTVLTALTPLQCRFLGIYVKYSRKQGGCITFLKAHHCQLEEVNERGENKLSAFSFKERGGFIYSDSGMFLFPSQPFISLSAVPAFVGLSAVLWVKAWRQQDLCKASQKSTGSSE